MTRVENLKKITLALQAGTSPGAVDLALQHPEFEFIFGLAPAGMTPFEYELLEKSVGEEILLHLKKDTLNRFFEHLNPAVWNLFDGREEIYLKAKITAVATADNREVVKAMAEMAAHGGGCDCGCGCG
jgi:hypothetical protein